MIKKYSKRKHTSDQYFEIRWNFDRKSYDVGRILVWGKDIGKYRVYDYTEDKIMLNCPKTKTWLKKEYEIDVDKLTM